MLQRSWFLVALAACSASATKPTTPATTTATAKASTPTAVIPTAKPTPPELRLPTTVRPTRNAVELTIDPASEDFTGTITSAIEIAEPTQVIWLNADEIAIASAKLSQGGAATSVTATATYPKKGYIALTFPAPLARGAATLSIAYAGKAHRDDGEGIYRVQEAGDWYAFTQFESTDARQAFPTFDEPSFKVPWQLTIHAKASLVAVANMPIASERAEDGGMKATTFVESKPMPSYLVAFAVGPFELLDAGKTSTGAPIRVVVPHGRGKDTGYVVKVTAELVERVEHYFGTPLPYPKLDLVAVPVFNAGAMENPGLITFRASILLVKPEEVTERSEQRYATVLAHEVAHHWFGDLVTLAWWDDTWLNESFASWAETKLVGDWKPAWEFAIDEVAGRSRSMHSDSLDTARAIRQPIANQGDIESAFDGITYGKGEAVLRMFERVIGADVFQRGVRTYLAKHAWGNATYDDFVAAMSEAAGRDLRPMFDSFIKQSGVPLVTATLACKAGTPPTLQLAQQRYAPIGSHIDPKRTWTIPLCVKWRAGTATGRDCGVLDHETGELALTATSCPTWVLPNEGEVGYYRVRLAGADLDHLLAHAAELTMPERVGLLADVNALVASGDLSSATALAFVADLAKDKSRHLVDASIEIVSSIDGLVADAQRANYERLVRKLYQGRARELGWHSRPGESADDKRLRPELLGLVAGTGKDRELIAQATALVWKWLDDHSAIEPELTGTALRVAARYGDQKLFDRLHADAKKATDRSERMRLLSALGGFADPKLAEQALAIVLTDEFDLREASDLSRQAMHDPRLRSTAYKFTRAHFDEIMAKLPPAYRAYMAFFAVEMCDDALRPELEAFLSPRIKPLEGGERALAQAMESLSLCAAGHSAQRPAIEAFLKKQ